MCLLIYRSGEAQNVFWLAYFGHTQLVAGLGFSARNMALIARGPAGLALRFALDRGLGSSMVSLLIGGVSAYFYAVMARVYYDLEASRAREAQLEARLARLRVCRSVAALLAICTTAS